MMVDALNTFGEKGGFYAILEAFEQQA